MSPLPENFVLYSPTEKPLEIMYITSNEVMARVHCAFQSAGAR